MKKILKFLGAVAALAVSALAVLVFIGVIVGNDDSEPQPNPTPTQPTELATPTTTPGDNVIPDVKTELGADISWTQDIVQTEPGRVEIHTTFADDGDGGDTMRAMALCEGAARAEGVTYAAVYETDGSVWVVYGHPAYPEGCTVV